MNYKKVAIELYTALSEIDEDNDLIPKYKGIIEDKPQILKEADITSLQETIQKYIDWIDSGQYNKDEDKEWEEEIFECAMTAFCDPSFFKWFNEVT